MPKNIMVKYVGPKKVMHVPFPADNKFPLESLSELDEVVDFPKNQMVELTPERAEALLKQSPNVFRMEGTIRPRAVTVKGTLPKAPSAATTITQQEYEDVSGDTDSPFQDTEPSNTDEGV